MPDPADRRIAVVMTTFDRCAGVLATLPRLLALPERPEVVVVDDASPDATAQQVARHFPQVRLVRAPRNLGSAARNLGVAAVDAPYVAFADDDSWWEPGALRRAADVLDAHPNVGLLAAAIDVGVDGGREDPTNALLAASPLVRTDLPGPEVLGFVACGAVVRREAFLAVGGFAERMHIGGEEELLALDLRSAGWRSVHVAGVRARHAPDATGERPGRRRRTTRNRLWTAWLRRPAGSALRVTGETLVHAARDPAARAGVVEAVRDLPRVLGERSPVLPDVEADLRRVARAERSSSTP
ncbi:glycosyltransferase family 2 protein [Egicoccus halophilus]|uniref:Glycosyl transferase n=1 Tax=Egicoccus halophilus TaxID=1670830 RepID=A0A8J3A6I2_9ACTN|nr:glycosyltransferase [Egicoccus halophilus]GGI04551.1 glycosyl transferase [Egicoccus halophilus]